MEGIIFRANVGCPTVANGEFADSASCSEITLLSLHVLQCRSEKQVLVVLHPHAHFPTTIFHSIIGGTRQLLQVKLLGSFPRQQLKDVDL